MAQINLLKQKTASENFWDILPGILSKVMILVFLATLGYYGWVYWENKKAGENILAKQSEISSEKSRLANVLERDELLIRQAQLEEVKKLVNSHKYWSQIIPILAKATLKNAAYTSMILTADGELALSVNVPDIKSLDKFLLVFDQKKVYENFSYVKIGGIRKTESQEKAGISVDVRMKFNANMLNYKNPADQK